MANIVITTTTNKYDVVFNDLATQVGIVKGTWLKDHVANILLKSDHVEVSLFQERTWLVGFDSSYMQIDSINAVAPTSNSDLYDKLIAVL